MFLSTSKGSKHKQRPFQFRILYLRGDTEKSRQQWEKERSTMRVWTEKGQLHVLTLINNG